MSALTTQNKPARRFVLVRYAQCEVHKHELAEGIAQARSSSAVSYALTASGMDRCVAARALFASPPFYAPAHQAGASCAYEPTAYYTDGSEQARHTLNALRGAPDATSYATWVDSDDALGVSSLCPIVIVAGSTFILDKLEHDLGLAVRFGPPLLSACVYDVFADGTLPFVHALGSRDLCPQSLYWANSA